MGNVCEVIKGRTLLVITQVNDGFKKLLILIFRNYKHLHVKIASLANVQSCITIVNVWPCIVSVDYLSGLVFN